jgi:hypothetical protein
MGAGGQVGFCQNMGMWAGGADFDIWVGGLLGCWAVFKRWAGGQVGRWAVFKKVNGQRSKVNSQRDVNGQQVVSIYSSESIRKALVLAMVGMAAATRTQVWNNPKCETHLGVDQPTPKHHVFQDSRSPSPMQQEILVLLVLLHLVALCCFWATKGGQSSTKASSFAQNETLKLKACPP